MQPDDVSGIPPIFLIIKSNIMRTINKKLTKRERDKLKRVCFVFFPEYKRIRITRKGKTILSRRALTSVKKREVFEYKYLMDYILPLKLSLFKYNNEQFIGEVYTQRVKSSLAGINEIEFYYSQILKLKLSEELEEDTIKLDNSISVEDEEGNRTFYYVLNTQLNSTRDIIVEITEKVKRAFSPIYYEVIGTVIVLLTVYIITSY